MSVFGNREDNPAQARSIQERRRLEDRLRAANDRLTEVLSSITDGFLTLDGDWNFVAMNPVMERIFGRPAAELLGRNIWEEYPGGVGGEFYRNYHLAVAERRPVHFEARSDTVAQWFETHVYPREGGVEIYVRNITDRKEVEEQLRRTAAETQLSRDLFEKIFSLSEVGLALVDAKGVYVRVNACYARIFGYEPSGLEGRHITVLLPEVDHETGLEALKSRLSGDESPTEWVMVTRSGEKRNIRACGTHAFKVGDQRFMIGSVLDVTDQKRAEDLLRLSESEFRLLTHAMPQVVWVSDPSGRTVFANQRWHEFTGLTLEQGNDPEIARSTLHEDEADRVSAAWAEALRTGNPHEIVYRCRPAGGGEYRWFMARAVPIRDSEGRITKWFGTATDIHDQRRVEEELKESHVRKDEFLAMLAHELRNPLGAITNAAHLLKDPAITEKTRSWARDVIDRQTVHLARLVDDLLDVSRITRGLTKLQKSPIDIASAVALALEIQRGGIEKRKQDLTVSVPPVPLMVEGDTNRLAQVIGNLLNNASKYTPEGGRIWLSVTHEGPDVVVRVRDTGIGIGADILPTVFDMFTQAEQTLDRSQGGLGIGLTVAQRLAMMHQGTVEAKSDGAGRGSEFVVRLPLFSGADSAPEPALTADPVPPVHFRP
jgi:PAS domain S-box-containing protein